MVPQISPSAGFKLHGNIIRQHDASSDQLSISSRSKFQRRNTEAFTTISQPTDFNGKRAKIIQTCRQIDDIKSGLVKTVVLANLLNCLDVSIDRAEFLEC